MEGSGALGTKQGVCSPHKVAGRVGAVWWGRARKGQKLGMVFSAVLCSGIQSEAGKLWVDGQAVVRILPGFPSPCKDSTRFLRKIGK